MSSYERYRFTIQNGAVTSVSEIEKGLEKIKFIPPNTTYTLANNQVIKTEITRKGLLKTTTYIDPDGDGLWIKVSENYQLAPSTPTPSPFLSPTTLVSSALTSPTTATVPFSTAIPISPSTSPPSSTSTFNPTSSPTPTATVVPTFWGDSPSRKTFTTDSNGNITALFEVKNGLLYPESPWEYSNVSRVGSDWLVLQKINGKWEIYRDGNGDGIYTEIAQGYGPSAPADLTGLVSLPDWAIPLL